MSEKATLYFVVTKVIAPKNSFFNLVLSVDNSKTILKSPKSRSNAYTIPYKIMKEVSLLDNKDQIYNIEIIFYDKDQPVSSGSVNINPKEFFKASSIELKQYDLNVPNMDISAFVGVALVPIGEPFLPDFDMYGNSAKIVSNDDSNENQSSVNEKLEPEPEMVESESGKRHRRKKGTTDDECITFISVSCHTHKKHRASQIPENSPSLDQKFVDDEIIRSESGRLHRRKRGTKDTKVVTFISEGEHVHRKRRSHQNKTNETENQQNKMQNLQNEIQNQNQQNENKIQDQQNEIQNQNQQNENKIQDQQNENKIQDQQNENKIHNQQNELQNQNQQNENKIQNQQNELQNQNQQNENENQQQHRRKRRSRSQQQQEKTENEAVETEKERNSTDSKDEDAVSKGSSSRRRKRTSESQPTQQEEQRQEEEKSRKRRHRKPESEEKNEEKQKEEEATTNSTTENRRRRKRKEKTTTEDGETETSSNSAEKH